METIVLWLSAHSAWMQILSLVTGVTYIIMQIFQYKWMWHFNLITAAIILINAVVNHDATGTWAPLWAQVLFNTYLIIMAVIGIVNWKKLAAQSDGKIHILKLSRKIIWIAAGIMLIGAPVICLLLSLTNDPKPVADGIAMTISIVAAWFLTRSHLEQWHLWIIADIFVIVVYASQAMWGLVALYVFYIISCCIGIYNWRKKGVWIEAGE